MSTIPALGQLNRRIDAFFHKNLDFLVYLHDRWQDEEGLENFADYRAVIERRLPDDFVLVDARPGPFSFDFAVAGAPVGTTFRITIGRISASEAEGRWERIS